MPQQCGDPAGASHLKPTMPTIAISWDDYRRLTADARQAVEIYAGPIRRTIYGLAFDLPEDRLREVQELIGATSAGPASGTGTSGNERWGGMRNGD